jgi:hypothetical protein
MYYYSIVYVLGSPKNAVRISGIFLLYLAQVVTSVMNALQSEIQNAAQFQAELLERSGKTPFLHIAAPPDGLCAYHSVIGSLSYSSWSKVKRHPNGIAVNRRIEQSESSAAQSLRGFALMHTPENDPVIAEQALEAQHSTTVDIGELSWLGESLNLAIRCHIADEAQWYSTVVYCSSFGSIANCKTTLLSLLYCTYIIVLYITIVGTVL